MKEIIHVLNHRRFFICANLSLLGCLLLAGCGLFEHAPRRINKAFNYEYKEREKYLNSIYTYQFTINRDSVTVETYDVYNLFFKDGTYCSFQSGLFKFYKVNSLQELLALACEGKKEILFRHPTWGYYEVKNDTICVKSIFQRPYGGGYWWATESEWVFTNEKNLKIISRKSIDLPKETRGFDENFKIIYLDTLPCYESDSWMKYEKWFWKNEQDYLNWVEKSGGNKNKYHFSYF